ALDPETGAPAEAPPYPHAALLQTWRTLLDGAVREGTRRWSRAVDVPHDVQELVEDAEPGLHLLGAEGDEVFEEALMSWWAEEGVAAGRGDQAVVPSPGPNLARADLHR